MDLKLQGKTVLIGGGSRGLGFGIAECLSREGANVSIAGRDKNQLNQAVSELSQNTGQLVQGTVTDLTDPNAIEEWIAEARDRFGQIDGLVVNCGGPRPGGFDDLTDADWQAAFSLTLMSAVRTIRSVLPDFRAAGTGAIVTVTSTSIKEPIESLLLSNVLRSGVASLVKSLSHELSGSAIRINNLVPGSFNTERLRSLHAGSAEKAGLKLEDFQQQRKERIPLGRFGEAAEFGKAATFLLSDAASYVTGATLVVDGGVTRSVW